MITIYSRRYNEYDRYQGKFTRIAMNKDCGKHHAIPLGYVAEAFRSVLLPLQAPAKEFHKKLVRTYENYAAEAEGYISARKEDQLVMLSGGYPSVFGNQLSSGYTFVLNRSTGERGWFPSEFLERTTIIRLG